LQLRRLLGIPSRDALDAFLKKRGVWLEYSLDDFRREGRLTSPPLTSQENDQPGLTDVAGSVVKKMLA
jgi:hypothetical protein